MLGGKRYLVLTGLVVALGLAVYVNWQMAPADNKLEPDTTVSQASKNLGDAQFVNADKTPDAQTVSADASSSDYFTQARLSRQTSRDEATDAINEILNKTSLEEKDKKEAVQKSVELADNIDKENKIENLVKAKGFKDCLAVIGNNQITIIVKSDGLLANEVAMIKDIVVGQTQIPAGNIKINEVK